MSNDVHSGIFDAIIGYFKKYRPHGAELYVTKYPVKGMDVYHYHRPNLETELKQKSVVTVHHDLEDTDPWFDSSIYIERYHEAEKVICLNALQSKLLEVHEGLDNTVIIPHGVNTDIFSPKLRDIPKGKLTIGIVSKRYGRRVKGEALLKELYKRLNPDKIRFVFVGEGRSIDAVEAESYGIEATVYEDLAYSMFDQLYAELDLLLIPSLFEGGPANVPEAIYTRLPIIGRKIAMIDDFVVEGENGYFLTGNPDEDADLINQLADNENNIFSNLLFKINKTPTKVPTWREVVDRHFSVYQGVMESKNESLEECLYD